MSCTMSARAAQSAILIDTNVLVYAYDRGAPDKQQQAIQVLDELAATGEGRLTAQVIGEFFRVTTKLSTRLLNAERAQQEISNFALTWTILDTTAMVVQEAVRGVLAHQLSYYDAQVWAA